MYNIYFMYEIKKIKIKKFHKQLKFAIC